jgi:hypothetical protein
VNEDIVLIVCLTMLIILCAGEPDLLDAIISLVMGGD